MSESESKFYRQLRLLLIGVLGPFIIAGFLNVVIMLPNVKANTTSIGKFDEAYVSNDVLMIYVNQLTKANDLTQKNLDKQDENVKQEIRDIREGMDDLLKEVYKSTKRGIPNIKQ